MVLVAPPPCLLPPRPAAVDLTGLAVGAATVSLPVDAWRAVLARDLAWRALADATDACARAAYLAHPATPPVLEK